MSADSCPTIFFSVGEPSGDLHGANLIGELKRQCPGTKAIGYGGPKMAAAGCRLDANLTALAVMFLWDALKNIRHFWRLYKQADRIFATERPDAVVLIDYPGFNWWIARRAKAHGIPVFYYGAPQIWAWANWRIKKMRRLIDQVLCKLPFEENWFRSRGVAATHVGHPYFDELAGHRLNETFIAEQTAQPGPLIAILPGSRTSEVRNNLPPLLASARRIKQVMPSVRFAIAAYDEHKAEMARELVAEQELPVDIHLDRTYELMHASHIALACSGSVSLELLYFTRPTVIYYKLSPLFDFLSSHLLSRAIKIRYVTLVNLLGCPDPFCERYKPWDHQGPRAAEPVFPEFPTSRDKTALVAEHALRWLRDPAAFELCRTRLTAIRQQVAHSGASRQAAAAILARLDAHTAESPQRSAA